MKINWDRYKVKLTLISNKKIRWDKNSFQNELCVGNYEKNSTIGPNPIVEFSDRTTSIWRRVLKNYARNGTRFRNFRKALAGTGMVT